MRFSRYNLTGFSQLTHPFKPEEKRVIYYKLYYHTRNEMLRLTKFEYYSARTCYMRNNYTLTYNFTSEI